MQSQSIAGMRPQLIEVHGRRAESRECCEDLFYRVLEHLLSCTEHQSRVFAGTPQAIELLLDRWPAFHGNDGAHPCRPEFA